MDIIYTSCAGIDIHQAMIAVCILHGSLTSTRPKREELALIQRQKVYNNVMIFSHLFKYKLLAWKVQESVGNPFGMRSVKTLSLF